MSKEPTMSDLLRQVRKETRQRAHERFFGVPSRPDPPSEDGVRMADIGADDERRPDTTKETPE